MRLLESIGTCPSCGDDLGLFVTRQHKRFVKCLNPECKRVAYPLPRRGKIELTGLLCPKDHLPLLAIIPLLRVNNKKRKDEKRMYFWAKGPCFDCFEASNCEAYRDAREEYLDEVYPSHS